MFLRHASQFFTVRFQMLLEHCRNVGKLYLENLKVQAHNCLLNHENGVTACSGVGLFNASSNPNRFVVLIAVDT